MRTIVLVGKSGAGKTTVGKELEKLGLKKIVTYTTRPPRPGEVDGVDYHFLSLEEFDRLDQEGFFAETAEYNAAFGYCRYGSSIDSYKAEGSKYIILNPIGLKSLLSKIDDIFPVYLKLSNYLLKQRLFERGDKMEEIVRRNLADDEDFADIEKYVKFTASALVKPHELAKEIILAESSR